MIRYLHPVSGEEEKKKANKKNSMKCHYFNCNIHNYMEQFKMIHGSLYSIWKADDKDEIMCGN